MTRPWVSRRRDMRCSHKIRLENRQALRPDGLLERRIGRQPPPMVKPAVGGSISGTHREMQTTYADRWGRLNKEHRGYVCGVSPMPPRLTHVRDRVVIKPKKTYVRELLAPHAHLTTNLRLLCGSWHTVSVLSRQRLLPVMCLHVASRCGDGWFAWMARTIDRSTYVHTYEISASSGAPGEPLCKNHTSDSCLQICHRAAARKRGVCSLVPLRTAAAVCPVG